MPSDSKLLAMLIDGDNAQPKLLDKVLVEAAKYGVVTTRRLYGDWTTPNMSGWKDFLHTHAIQPMQQFRYTTGKNATDSALIIDAMDLLHGSTVGGFCIVSSDSDYTRLATRLREQGLFVMGVGEQKTPKSFVNACEVFVYTENLSPKPKVQDRPVQGEASDWIERVAGAIEVSADDDGWSHLSSVGSNLGKLQSDFDPRTYGYKKLSQLLKSRPDKFETKGSGASIRARAKS